MIFVNRRRIKQNSGIVKDPTKYWYIEKYVYGVLKETIEIALGSGTTFGSMSSGYSDDTFYGWSIDSTSTKITFNNTSTYKNTTTTVKNNLDDKNTLKIYAVYSYIDPYGKTSSSAVSATYSEVSLIVSGNGTAAFSGYRQTVDTSNGNITYYDLNLTSSSTCYAKIDNNYVTGTVNQSTSIKKSVTKDQIIKIKGSAITPSSGNFSLVQCTVPHYESVTYYRVVAHGGYDFGTGGEIIPIN